MDVAVTQMGLPLNYSLCMALAVNIINQAEDCDRITIVFNEFKNMITYS